MLRRNLLYTAVTRVAKNLALVGEQKVFLVATNIPGNNRKAGLAKKIVSLMPQLEQEEDQQEDNASNIEKAEDERPRTLTKEAIYLGKIDPMIGMQGTKLEKLN